MKLPEPVGIIVIGQVLAQLFVIEFKFVPLDTPIIAIDSSVIVREELAVIYPEFIYLLRTYLFTGAPVISPDPITVSGLFLSVYRCARH